jgi:hypothetical protein
MAHKKWGQDHCLDALKRFAEESQSQSILQYEMWRRSVGDAPSISPILQEFGTWNEALTALNMELKNDAMGKGPEKKIAIRLMIKLESPLEQSLSFLHLYEEHCKEQRCKATRDGFQEWHKTQQGCPSIATIEKFGSWNDMRLRAADAAGVDRNEVKLIAHSRKK